jgi:hypothetical protein
MKRLRLALWVASVALTTVASAEELRLKTRIINPELSKPEGLQLKAAGESPRSISGRKWHWLIQFDSSTPDLKAWEQRGASIISSVPVNGYVIAVPEGMSWEDLSFTYRAPIQASDKMSPQVLVSNLNGDTPVAERANQLVIIHFHKDVETWEADAIVEAEGVQAIGNGSLEREDRLAEITVEQMAALALWDEVEYIFPAPVGMKEGEMFLGCGGVISGGYEVAMLAASFGEGWDGPGRGRANITYSFGNLGTRTDATQTRAEVRKALEEWSKAVAVTFSETSNRSASRNLDILFATGNHGDPFPFLSGSTVLGHSFYPSPPNPEPIAGDIHINDAWAWSIGGQWDVYSVILHELGHSLGIGHTDTPGSVMYPYYQKATGLKQQDIDSIRQLYAAPAATPTAPTFGVQITSPAEGARLSANTVNVSGSITGGTTALQISYTNTTTNTSGPCMVNSVNTAYSCPAVPLVAGANAIRVISVQGTNSSILVRNVTLEANQDVNLTITSPAQTPQSTAATEIRVTGTTSHPGGIASIRWSTNRGRSGNATGLETWSALIALETGTNEITIVATSRSGISSSRRITIERTAAPQPVPPTNPGGDRVPPRMTIQQPIGNFIITSSAKLTFRGTATDNVGVTQVTWTNSAGDQSGSASASTTAGTVSWSFDVNIAVGFNAIQVRAWDSSGNSTLYSTTVRRY